MWHSGEVLKTGLAKAQAHPELEARAEAVLADKQVPRPAWHPLISPSHHLTISPYHHLITITISGCPRHARRPRRGMRGGGVLMGCA
jgi:hypothetical protein